MSRVSRGSTAGARYLDLQREARRTGRPTDELIQLYALECFLDRLSRSVFVENLILKGGVLLAALNARRPTRDIDLVALSVLEYVCKFADPVIRDEVDERTWDPAVHRWRSSKGSA